MNIEIYDFVFLQKKFLQKKFEACCCMLPAGPHPKHRCTPICGAAMLLRCNWCRNLAALTALNSSHPIHAVDGHCARNSCIKLLWLHPNHKMSITYHKTESVVTNPQAGGLPLKKFA